LLNVLASVVFFFAFLSAENFSVFLCPDIAPIVSNCSVTQKEKGIYAVRRLQKLLPLHAIARVLMGSPRTGNASSLDTTTSAYPLKVSTNGRYLVDQGGKPFRINSDAAWLMSVQAAMPDVDTYLANRKAKGFNTFVLMVLNHGIVRNAPNNRYGEGPFTIPDDFSKPNNAYFSFIDTIVDKAAAQGMAVLFAYTVLGYNGGSEGWWSVLTNAKNTRTVCYNWGVWLGNRYKSRKNIIWLAGGDYTPPSGSEGELRAHKILEGIKSTGAAQLFAAQWSGPDTLATDVRAFADAMDVNTFYGYGPFKSGRTYETAQRAYGHRPVLPAVLFEPNYENEVVGGTGRREDVRRSQYWAVLAGATAGQNFGSKEIWNWQRTWEEKLESNGSLDMQRAFALFDMLPWYELVPSGGAAPFIGKDLVPTGGGDGLSYIAAAASPAGTWLLAYVPPTGTDSKTFSIDMTAMRSSTHARWYNPTSGAFASISSSIPNVGRQQFRTPGNNGSGTNDWLLVLNLAQASPQE
jgi:hypothetical protein